MAAIDLCGLDEVRQHLQRQTSATEQDEVLEALITRLSRAIAGHVERELAPPVTEARTIQFDPRSCVVSVAPWDLRAVTSLVIDNGLSGQQTLTTDQWQLTLQDRRHGVWRGLEMPWVVPSAIFGTRQLTITGDWGFAEVPEEAAQACISAVAMYVRGEVQAFGSALQPNSLGDGVNADQFLPPGIRGMLRDLKLETYI